MIRIKLLFILPFVLSVTAQNQNGVEYYGGTSNVRYQQPRQLPPRRVLQPRAVQGSLVTPVTASPPAPATTLSNVVLPQYPAINAEPRRLYGRASSVPQQVVVSPPPPQLPIRALQPEPAPLPIPSAGPQPTPMPLASSRPVPVLESNPQPLPAPQPHPARLLKPAPQPQPALLASPSVGVESTPAQSTELPLPTPFIPVGQTGIRPHKHVVYVPMWANDKDEEPSTVVPAQQPTQQPIVQPQPVLVPEPTVQPEPIIVPEPTVQPEPIIVPEPTVQPEPIIVPEPTVQPEPIIVPEPAAEPQPVVVPKPQPVVVPEQKHALIPLSTIQPQPILVPDPAPKPEPVVAHEIQPVVVPEPQPLVVPEPQPLVVSEPQPIVVREPTPQLLPVPAPKQEQPSVTPQREATPLSPQPLTNSALPPLLPKPEANRRPAYIHHTQAIPDYEPTTPPHTTHQAITMTYPTPPPAPTTYPTPPPAPTTYRTKPPITITYATPPPPPPRPTTYYPTPFQTLPTTEAYKVIPSKEASEVLNFNCAHGDGYYPVAHECDSYIECRNDRAIKYFCLDGLHFNPNAKRHEYPCAYPSEVQCSAGASQQTAQSTNQCPRQYGLFSLNDGECSKYISCQEGLATIMNCPLGLVFNPLAESCDWPINVPQCNPQAFSDLKCPDPPLDEHGAISDIVYKYRYHHQCSLYVGCQRGSPRLLSCEPGLFFDDKSQECVNEDFVTDCDRPRR